VLHDVNDATGCASIHCDHLVMAAACGASAPSGTMNVLRTDAVGLFFLEGEGNQKECMSAPRA